MSSTWNKRGGFTLVELLVVIAMIAVIAGAMGSAVAASQKRARIQKALTEVKMVHQAILAYENYARGGSHDLPTMKDRDADANALGFLIGKGASADSGGKVPVLLQAVLQSGDTMRDPWGTPYKITIEEGSSGSISTSFSTLQTGYSIPNFYRLSAEERK